MFYAVGISIAWILRARERAQMNATPPEASSEYSRGGSLPDRGIRRGSHAQAAGRDSGRSVIAAILAGGLLGAALLLVAEFTPLFHVNAAGHASPVKTVTTGSHQSYALVPIAVLAAALALGVWWEQSRPALLATGLLGVIALLIALLGDLPDAHASGLIGSSLTQFTDASSSPAVGLYLETLGAVVLVITCVSGFILIGPPPKRSRSAGS